MGNPAFDLLEAFKDSGMSEDNAKKAANALLRLQDRQLDAINEGIGEIKKWTHEVERHFDQVNARLKRIEQRMDSAETITTSHSRDIASLKADNRLIKWMVGFNLGFTVLLVVQILFG